MPPKTQERAVTIPLSAIQLLYKNAIEKKIVCELDIDALRYVNEPSTIDEMIDEAHLEYATGKTHGFKDVKKLINFLET